MSAITEISASELILVLREAKKSLIKDKKILDKKDNHEYPIIDIPFSIPNNWKWVYLSDVSIIQEGPGIRKHQYSDDGIQFLTVTNILDGSVDLDKSKKYMGFEEYKQKYQHFTINRGDIVTACSGATWGKSAIYDEDDVLMLNTSTLRLRFFNDLSDNKYLYYLTKSDFFKNNLKVHSTGQQPNYGYSHYSRIPIPLPPLKEQQQIVAILDEAFAALEQAKANIEKNIANAKELFQSKLNAIFSQKGEGWEEKNLKELTTKIGSGSTPRGGQASYKSEGISLVRSMNVHDLEFKERNLAFIDEAQAKELNGVTLQEGDVLLNITGASVARCCVVPSEFLPARVNQHVSIIRPKKEIIDSRFLNLLLTSKPYKDQLLFTGEQGATRQAITKAQIEAFKINFPAEIQRQNEIVKSIDIIHIETERLRTILQAKLLNLDELKKSILQKAFSGELTSKKLDIA
jgi:type I restriction enzyme, S subunit